MRKRILGPLLFACLLVMLLLSAAMVFIGATSQAAVTMASQAANSNQANSLRSASRLAPSNVAAGPGIWTDIAPFPTVTISPTPGSYPLKLKRACAAAYPSNGKIYLFGGRHGTDGEDITLQWIWEYAPGNPGSWVRKNALLDSSQFGSRFTANMACATLTDASGPRIYVIGGNSINSEPTPVVRVYDPNADQITTLTGDPWPASPVRVPGAYAVYNNKLYIFGGFSSVGQGGVFTDTWEFDPMAADTHKWRQLTTANLNLGRGYMAGAILDGMIYAIGGDTWDSVGRTLVPVNNVERMDPSQANPTWTNVASLPTARGDLGAWAYDTGTGYSISGHIAVAGGIYPEPDNTAYLYNPTGNTWSTWANLLHATRNYGVAQLNGDLYALGGYDYTNHTPAGANFNQRYDATLQGTATPTVTGTRPTFTNTPMTTNTPSITSTPCNNDTYTYTSLIGPLIAAATTDTGNHGDNVVTQISLPFPFTLYDTSYSTANVSSNGNLQFTTANTAFTNDCLPDASMGAAIFAHWDDLRTDADGPCFGGCGIYTSVDGTEPNRIFNVRWSTYYTVGRANAYFEIRLYEGAPSRFEVIMGLLDFGGLSATIGVQDETGAHFTQFECNKGIFNNTDVSFVLQTCNTTPTATSTTGPSSTPPVTVTRTYTPGPTIMASPTNTRVGTATTTPTECTISFADVHPTDYFYTSVIYLACHNVISGYSDGTFRPYNNTTRGQVSKIIVLAEGLTLACTTQHFTDVPPTHPFYCYIETAYQRGIISGYSDGTFRPGNDVTRAQLCKMVVIAEGWANNCPSPGHFTDVPPTYPFFCYVETAYNHGIISGYGDGTFRPGNSATRGQICKIVYTAITGP